MVDKMISCYCLGINFQYSHLPCWEQQEWLRRRAEAESMPLPSEQKRNILRHLMQAGMHGMYLCFRVSLTCCWEVSAYSLKRVDG
jgi:2-oxoglutarate dehydrogenase complex dehydrogenase (E1) component-like enzyme